MVSQLTGNTDLEIDPETEQVTAYSHAAGYTRNARMDIPPDWQQRWLIRGPCGQVKLAVDPDGKVSDFFGYGSFGSRIEQIIYDSQQHVLPAYIDSDMTPIESFPQLKLAAGTAEDMTQMVGALDAPEESGAAAIGASVNPDTMPGGNATFLQEWARRKFGPGPEMGPMRVPPELQQPGPGEGLEPSAAPPTVQERASVADLRLAGMWEPQEYYGAKPGFQLGSWYVDDLRNTRLPLPMSPPVGGVTGPPGWAGLGGGRDWWLPPELRHPWHVLPAYPPRDPLPELGPHPLLPNPDSGRTEACGTTEAKGGGSGSGGNWDSYYRNMEAAAGGSFARPDPGSGGSAGAGSAQSASSGGRSKEPNDALDEQGVWAAYYAAMAAAMKEAGGTAWGPPDETDPDTALGVALFEQLGVPFAGFLYDKANQLTHGWLNESINSMPRWAVEVLAGGIYAIQLVAAAASLGLTGMGTAGVRLGGEAGEAALGLGAKAVKLPAWARAEAYLNERIPGISQWRILPEGFWGRESRTLDRFNPFTKIAYDVKTGRRAATTELEKQIAKDVAILKDPNNLVKRIEWWFMRGETGGLGPEADLARALRAAGIRIRIIRKQI